MTCQLNVADAVAPAPFFAVTVVRKVLTAPAVPFLIVPVTSPTAVMDRPGGSPDAVNFSVALASASRGRQPYESRILRAGSAARR